MVLITVSQTRKERRKEKRNKRKRHQNDDRNDQVDEITHAATVEKNAPKREDPKKVKKKRKLKEKRSEDKYTSIDPDLAAAIRRDDEEIAALESKLGLGRNKKSKAKLNKEYSKLEGYGDDFGDFLDDLDNMVNRISGPKTEISPEAADGEERIEDFSEDDEDEDSRIDDVDPTLAAALERDEEEIADLEKKLGIGKKKDKEKLLKEYQAEGYGDDFGDFLDGLDDMMVRVSSKKSDAFYEQKLRHNVESEEGSHVSEDEEEELVPMKGASYDSMDEDDSVLEELERAELEEDEENSDTDEDPTGKIRERIQNNLDQFEGSESDSEVEDSDEDKAEAEPDHDIADTYRPSKGQDIYGKSVDSNDSQLKEPKKYVPPHLRSKQIQSDRNEEQERNIRRALNNSLNRLSEDTLISVAQQVAKVYSSFPTQIVHEVLWKLTKSACVETPILMKALIPVYLACLVGVNIQTGDTVQTTEYILEATVTELWGELTNFRRRHLEGDSEDNEPSEVASKKICNRMLVLCYLYNYNVVHCSFMYDVIRHLIEEFTEIDIECLLLLLSHSGHSLRSDDPLALKEIVLLVQKKEAKGSEHESSSRAQYMVSAITDLKNNRRGKSDTVYGEKTSKMKKQIGRMKSLAAKSNTAKTSTEASLRISLTDILNADTKGRWWKVGASWVGNQYRYNDGDAPDNNENAPQAQSTEETEDAELLRLASKYRMNTDRKRAIFCIVMGSEDCDDAFEKLCRGSMLQNRSERDACRVLLECCGHEKSYNKFYGHLAARMCEYQPQCKFSLQLAFWDLFKQFDSIEARKAANMAKFLFHLVVSHNLLRLMTVIKAMDITEDEMEESAMIFLTILLSSILDYFNETSQVKQMFASRFNENEDPSKIEQEEGARASLLVFMMETMKASPKNQKGTQFRKNLKAAIKALDTDGFEDMF